MKTKHDELSSPPSLNDGAEARCARIDAATVSTLSVAIAMLLGSSGASAIPIPGGSLNPIRIPKYVSDLPIPPEMPDSTVQPENPSGCVTDMTQLPAIDPNNPPADIPAAPYTCGTNGVPNAHYNIAQRQFQQQILPSNFRPTTVWSYGRAEDPIPNGPAPQPLSSGSSFNYPAFTIENTAGEVHSVRWINELVKLDPNTGKPYPAQIVTPGSCTADLTNLVWNCTQPSVMKNADRKFLPHVLKGSVDQSLHWAKPNQDIACDPAHFAGATVDCTPALNDPLIKEAYTGPIPMVVHVHGAHVNAISDGYSEAWWLPDASDIDPLTYALRGSKYDQFDKTNAVPGSAFYQYENNQPASIVWYHDHALGMTHNNVYAGPAGFWLLRGNYTDPVSKATITDISAQLPGGQSPFGRPTHPSKTYTVNGVAQPGCDPNFDTACREQIRDIPLAIQDRSFNTDGSLFYPTSRAFFDIVDPNVMIPFIGDPVSGVTNSSMSDIAPIWNPEFFGNSMVVNGKTWPIMQVAPERYRFRILNGTDARFLNLALFAYPPQPGKPHSVTNLELFNFAQRQTGGVQEIPFFQVGSEQGYLPKVAMISTGYALSLNKGQAIPAVTVLPGNTRNRPNPVPAGWCNPRAAVPNPMDPGCEQALLLGPAERADVVIDFSALPDGTYVRMTNKAADGPFGGFPPLIPTDDGSTAQVMVFQVNHAIPVVGGDTPPNQLTMPTDPQLTGKKVIKTRQVSLNESTSDNVCVVVNALTAAISIVLDPNDLELYPDGIKPFGDIHTLCNMMIDADGNPLFGVPYLPRAAELGTMLAPAKVGPAAGYYRPSSQKWMDAIRQAPKTGSVETWEIYNNTIDAHPIHLHLVRFQVVDREPAQQILDPFNGTIIGARPLSLAGRKQNRPALPNEIGFKDTVISYPGEITRVKAFFDTQGLYVWHCHIVEHEDNEMMVSYCIDATTGQASKSGQCTSPGGSAPAVPVVPGS
ncbi:multicopper oxidase domain-containing protein [Methylotetracoccus oryzae]|uniref:multicopper oxidase domain-containing protein n=1 Tax=Methylotetracoccus oryzae TaxID=1919059 RepID=UPI00191182FE|nr:multicopper oxidase domain-containing protein [Methylotetracoccus oryzae]